MLQALGGRKFLMALIAIGVGTAIEITTERGISVAFAGLLTGILATFSTTNYMATKEHFKVQTARKTASQKDISPENNIDLTPLNELSSEMNLMKGALVEVTKTVKNLHNIILGAMNVGKQS